MRESYYIDYVKFVCFLYFIIIIFFKVNGKGKRYGVRGLKIFGFFFRLYFRIELVVYSRGRRFLDYLYVMSFLRE